MTLLFSVMISLYIRPDESEIMEITSKDEAIKKGLQSYFNGIPCASGHVSEKSVKNNRCRECQRAANLRSYAKHGEEIKADKRRQYAQARKSATKPTAISIPKPPLQTSTNAVVVKKEQFKPKRNARQIIEDRLLEKQLFAEMGI